ncbi:MAG: allophanate hydrolase [Variovorax paradoxus]|nr:MAG: allophanate hydrolase [Variovorax paradoxus]PZQ15630.1 MAG: allophanate hydrolase [Variovorax paradoxus]
MRFLPVNFNVLLVELADLEQTLALLHALQAQPLPGIVELVPAARTLLVNFRPSAVTRAALQRHIAALDLGLRVARDTTLVEVPVRYDGEDLDDVARLLGLTRREVVQRHTGSLYNVAFCGFAPGFAYLAGGDPVFKVPRRSSPRTKVPEGSVALGGAFSGIYPKASPGGWQIIGTTELPMWDLARPVPALLQPGFQVRFVEQGARVFAGPVPTSAPPAEQPPAISDNALLLRRPGLQALLQDQGRSGQVAQGVSASGAMDQGALRAANRLVGNDSREACIELVAYGGFEVESQGDLVVAVTGADVPATLHAPDGRRWPVSSHQALALGPGDRLHLGAPRHGVRAYLAVRGGFDVAPVLGSRSTDTLAFIGPAPLAAGDRLPVRATRGGCAVGAPAEPPPLPCVDETVVLDVVMGPRTDWFTPEGVARLFAQEWRVTPQSNRVGLRLEGAQPLLRAVAGELPSEGTALGALQVPPSGHPVLFMADHPLTGGYPVIATVATHHLDRAGQIPVHARVRFNPVSAFDPVEAGA